MLYLHMLKSQLDNLIDFYFLFNGLFMPWENESPDYILEKWDKYIGVDFDLNIYQTYESAFHNSWIKKWKVKESELPKLNKIIILIDSFSSISDLESLVKLFEKEISPINIINKEYYDNLHYVIKIHINKWINYTKNKRDYNLYLLLND